MSRCGMVRGLHHAAYRCRDAEQTREFYEDFLGLPLVDAFEIQATITNKDTPNSREADVLHVFFEMADGSCVAFFQEPGAPFDFKEQRDFDLHLALEVDSVRELEKMYTKGKNAGINTRGISDHGFIKSIYFRDPNGYVVELTTPTATKPGGSAARAEARQALDVYVQRPRSKL